MEMRNLKTKDLPKMIKIIRKLELKDFLMDSIDKMFNEDVDPELLKELKDKTEEEKKEIIGELKDETLFEMINLVLDLIIDNYERAYDEINDFVGGLYDISKEEVEELDLADFIECFYNIKNQEKIMVFFKTALK